MLLTTDMRKTFENVSKMRFRGWGVRLTHALRWREKREVRREREVFVLEEFAKRDLGVCSVCSACLPYEERCQAYGA